MYFCIVYKDTQAASEKQPRMILKKARAIHFSFGLHGLLGTSIKRTVLLTSRINAGKSYAFMGICEEFCIN